MDTASDGILADQQAVISDLRRELAEAQTERDEAIAREAAVAQVLGAINHSTFDLDALLQTMVAAAHRLCRSDYSVLFRKDGEEYRWAAGYGLSAEYEERERRVVIRPGPGTIIGRAVFAGHAVQIADARTDPLYEGEAEQDARTMLGVPLLRAGRVVGGMGLARNRVEAFTDREVELVTTFADQAVIALENARLLTETQEALDQQTATAEVLGVINSSPGDLTPVFETMLEKAMRLCEAAFGSLLTYDGERLTAASLHSVPPAFATFLNEPLVPEPGTALHQVLTQRRLVHWADAAAEPGYAERMPLAVAGVEGGGVRTLLGVPLIKDARVLGVFHLYRQDVRPFTDKQIALVQNFAAQAVIAMENARLFNELNERTEDLSEALEYQTATSDVLKAISRSAINLDAVLRTVVSAAVQLCRGEYGVIFRNDGSGEYRFAAGYGNSPEYEARERQAVIRPGRGTIVGRAALEGRAVQIADALSDPDYEDKESTRLDNAHSMLGVPLMRDGQVVGAFGLARSRIEPFSEREVELVTVFADQAVIAIENTRLIGETREALDQQTATAEVLGVINASPGDLTPVFETILDKAHALCGAERGTLFLYDGEKFKAAVAHGYPEDVVEHLRAGTDIHVSDARYALLFTGNHVHIHDLTQVAGSATTRIVSGRGGVRTNLLVPLFRSGEVLGMISCNRTEVRPFSDKEIALIENFAAQAVIAIENARLITETREALDRQTATAEVLGVINASPGDLLPVFDAMLEKANYLCETALGILWTFDGINYHPGAIRGPQTFIDAIKDEPRTPGTGGTLYRHAAGETLVHIEDMAADAGVYQSNPTRRAFVDLAGARSSLSVSLRKDSVLLGALQVYRQEVRPFTDKQIALLQNFAQQAVIAMENARLITETQEALERQTATSEVLETISSSPGHLDPVFEAVLANAVRICGGRFGLLALSDGDGFRGVAAAGLGHELSDNLSRLRHPPPGTGLHRLQETLQTVQIADCAAEPAYDAVRVENPPMAAVRTALHVPMLKEGALLGAIMVYRDQVAAFTDKETELVEGFAKQAVIAMENARLITETREALDQQTATAEVLGVINASPGDLAPVFDAMLEKAMRLCEASFGALTLFEGTHYTAVAVRGIPPGLAELVTRPVEVLRTTVAGRILFGGEEIFHAADISTLGSEFRNPSLLAMIEHGARTTLWISLRKEGVALGFLVFYREEVRPFSEKQVALLQNFAAQAVIAIENARLLDEIRQRQAELRVTFENMADGVVMFDQGLRLAAWNRNFQELVELPDAFLAEPRTFAEYIRYLAERGEFGDVDPEAELARLEAQFGDHYSFNRTRPDGTIIEVRHNPMPEGGFVLIYSDITERKRSEEEIRKARDTAEAALTDLKAAQGRLIQAEKMASLGQLTAGIAHEIKNPLNFVNNFASLSVELLDELKEVAEPALAGLDEDKRDELDETIGMLTGNLEKIAEHGKRADNIVKSMLEHSRGVSGERRAVDLNALVEEALNLAYHGARAQDQSFNITLERDLDHVLRPIELVPQDMTRVFLNLFGNGFYAANKRAQQGEENGFRPVLHVATREVGDAVEVRVRDNGIGIPPDIRDKLFQPFFTTKPTGEGTGLGLSITYDIVTQQHGGTIAVDSAVGQFTEFTVRLPRQQQART